MKIGTYLTVLMFIQGVMAIGVLVMVAIDLFVL